MVDTLRPPSYHQIGIAIDEVEITRVYVAGVSCANPAVRKENFASPVAVVEIPPSRGVPKREFHVPS